MALSKLYRQQVADRARHCCEYCLSQAKYSSDYLSIEHIIALARGGNDHLDNLAYACLTCNGHKYTHITGIDPVSGNEVGLFHPRTQQWDDHFRWNHGCTIMEGITPTGRATVERLKLNRASLINLRGVLFQFGKHPPF